jgi:uncharacterized protein YfaS (alpha-2-macroglobulin family)
MFYGSGRGGHIEATATAALAMLRAQRHPATARAALGWLVTQKDSRGTWHSTQATVLSLKALLAGVGRTLADPQERKIDVLVDGETLRTITIPADQADVVQQLDITAAVAAGSHRLRLVERTDTAAGYQVMLRYHLPGEKPAAEQQALTVEVEYDRTSVAVDETLAATARLRNCTASEMPMVILDLPVPAGFAILPDEFDALVASGRIARYQITPQRVIVYLRSLPPGDGLELRYRLRATMPVKTTSQPARAYEYYNPDRRGESAAIVLTVQRG